jgi:hypothetical protein
MLEKRTGATSSSDYKKVRGKKEKAYRLSGRLEDISLRD